MKIISQQITRRELKEISAKMFGNLVKAVVDIDLNIMAIDGELHSDEEAFLIKKGSKQLNLWGINLYPELTDDNFIEFDSMINLRPSQNNRSRGVDNPETQNKIKLIVNNLIKDE